MQDIIKRRIDFREVNIQNTAYLVYEQYNNAPKWSDFKYGENCTIILRNCESGNLERIDFIYSGCIPLEGNGANGYISFWGDIEASGPHACLVFNFDSTGKCVKITVSFCAPSMDSKTFSKLSEDCKYPAQITTKYDEWNWDTRRI